MQTDIALGAIGVERYLRAIEHHQQLVLVGMQPGQQAVECGEAGASVEDAVEAGTQFATASRTGSGAIRLEIVVEAPDQRAHALLRGAMQIGECIQLVHQPLRMHPAQRMPANGKLAGIVADNHHVAQQPVRVDAAPQCPFGGDADWVRCDLHCADAEAVEMRLPGHLIGEPCPLMCGQLMDGRSRQGSPAHIVQRRVVDDIVCVPGAQQIEEVQPALARPGAEPGKFVIADLRAEAVPARVTRARVVHGDPGGRLQACPQNVTVLGQEPILSGDQQAHHLSLGDGDADPPQLCHQTRHGHLPLMVLRQHETAQLRPEMPDHAGRQGRQHDRSGRCDPSLPSVAYRLGTQHDVLHHEALVAFEA
jgi:hypothetical protein